MSRYVIAKLILLTFAFGVATFLISGATAVGASYAHYAAGYAGICGVHPGDIPERPCSEDEYLSEFFDGFALLGSFFLFVTVATPTATLASFAMCIAFVRSLRFDKPGGLGLHVVVPAYAAGVLTWLLGGQLVSLAFIAIDTAFGTEIVWFVAAAQLFAPLMGVVAWAALLSWLLARELRSPTGR